MKSRPAVRPPAAVLPEGPDVARAIPRSAKVVVLGSATLGYLHKERRPRAAFDITRQRLREIEAVIRFRHNGGPVDTDDGEIYVEAASAHIHDPTELADWARRWAPRTDVESFLADIDPAAPPRRLRADSIATLLCVRRCERDAIGLTTIGAVDFDKRQRKAERKAQDRAYQAERRARGGARAHADSERRTQPWKTAGVSRATWYRMKRETNSSAT